MSTTIGIIGLGIIGGAWARHYESDGVLRATWNRTPHPDAPKWTPDLETLPEKCDVIQIVVADPPAVRAILEKILPKLASGKTVVQSSTIDPQSSDEFRAKVLATGADYLEAPFTGSKPAAEARQTVFYLGGADATILAMEPLLSRISTVRLRIGDHKQAATLKLAMNLNIAAQMQALSETLTFSRRAGIADDIYFDALSRNIANSGVVKLKEPKLRAGDFSTQFSVKHMLKDMRLATLSNTGDKLPLLDTVRDCLANTDKSGYGDEDISALLRLLG